ncbi:MAG: DegT/DnrJ/EryC1/StrS family aminotransferase, partial [Candidatus Omnitrophica bacterium]|nr:DegT/DnrJ/EryC1/StrS family aminotransferase [Candidatus Omnitrophota bacterium]
MKQIPISKPYFDKKEAKELIDTLQSGWVMQGPKVEMFEREFARYTGSKYAIATSSGTTALHLALEASGVGNNDEVITTAFSFIATANSILYCGAHPVFCDIDLKTYNLDP